MCPAGKVTIRNGSLDQKAKLCGSEPVWSTESKMPTGDQWLAAKHLATRRSVFLRVEARFLHHGNFSPVFSGDLLDLLDLGLRQRKLLPTARIVGLL